MSDSSNVLILNGHQLMAQSNTVVKIEVQVGNGQILLDTLGREKCQYVLIDGNGGRTTVTIEGKEISLKGAREFDFSFKSPPGGFFVDKPDNSGVLLVFVIMSILAILLLLAVLHH